MLRFKGGINVSGGGGGYQHALGGYMLGGGGLHAWGGGGGYMLGGGGATCLAEKLLQQYNVTVQSYIEDNPVEMIFCCAVIQMQMIIFSSRQTLICFKCRVVMNPLSLLSPPRNSCKYTNLDLQVEAITCNSMSDIQPVVSMFLS